MGLGRPIVPAGLHLNNSNLVPEAVRPGAGVVPERRSLVTGAIARGGLVQFTAATVPYPWYYWLTLFPQAENRPEVARFIAWLEEEIALRRQQISAQPSAEGDRPVRTACSQERRQRLCPAGH